MIIRKYLIISATEGRYGGLNEHVKMVERPPKLRGNEVSVRLAIDLPDSLFKRPELQAELKVPETAVREINITPDVTDNIEKIIKEATGLTVSISVIEQEDDNSGE